MFNGLSDNLTSNVELLADDTSFFSVVQDANTSAKELNDDLKKVNDWALQRKISKQVNKPSKPSKQAQEVFFSHKSKRLTHPPFNNSFTEKLEFFQYNLCLALTGAIRDTSKEKKNYLELGLESFQGWLCCRKLCLRSAVENFCCSWLRLSLLEHERNKGIIKTMNKFLTKDNMNK